MASSPRVDFLVMGAGVAGLRAAVELADHGEVLVVTKESVAESNTHYAQGGIAVAMEGDEDVSLHLDDTIGCGRWPGLPGRPQRCWWHEGPLRVAELIEWGTKFDRASEGDCCARARGRTRLPRILHANGDATGAEISRSLVALCARAQEHSFAEWTTVTGLVVG